MLGNDIIDLHKANVDSNWKRKGYLDKLFSLKEQALILTAIDPNIMLWLLWSMKEAAYKIVFRASLERSFNPKKFNCKTVGLNGEVNFEQQLFFTKSEVNGDFIHTIAVVKHETLNHTQTSFLANTADYLADFNSTSESYTLAKDDNGIPNLVNHDTGESRYASVSHHGKYLAVVYSKTAGGLSVTKA